MNSITHQNQNFESVCGPHRHCLFVALDYLSTVTELFQSPQLAYETVPQHVVSAPSLPVFCFRLKTHLLVFCYSYYSCRACEVTFVITDTLIDFAYLLTYLLNVCLLARFNTTNTELTFLFSQLFCFRTFTPGAIFRCHFTVAIINLSRVTNRSCNY